MIIIYKTSGIYKYRKAGNPAVRHLMNDKETFVIEYLQREQFVDILNHDFMVEFANRFNCKGRRMSIGAPRVPLAGRTLSVMFKKGLLNRFTVGIDAYAGGVGFPKWVYSYSLKMPNKACSGRLSSCAENSDEQTKSSDVVVLASYRRR